MINPKNNSHDKKCSNHNCKKCSNRNCQKCSKTNYTCQSSTCRTQEIPKNILGEKITFYVKGNALNIYTLDQSGRTKLYGFVPLYTKDTIPRPISTRNSISQRYTVAPYRVVYINQPSKWYPYDAMANDFYGMIDAGFNIINLTFLVNGQPADMCIAWQRELAEINPKTGLQYRREILNYAHDHGCSILASAGGATDYNYAQSLPENYANIVCDYILANELDGVDYDLEFIQPGFVAPNLQTAQQTIDWLVKLTDTTRSRLGPYALISHAPQQPYMNTLGQSNTWAGISGGYSGVENSTTNIDFYNVQCYNQNDNNYNSFNNIFITSGQDFPYSAFTQTNIPLNKLVMGKPMRQTDASTGYQTPQALNQILTQAKSSISYIGSVMTWQYPYNEPNPSQFCDNWLDIVTNNI